MESKTLYLPPSGWVRRNVVLAHIPFGTTKLDEEIRAGRFPPPRSFGARMVAWNAAEVHQWIKAQETSAPVAASALKHLAAVSAGSAQVIA